MADHEQQTRRLIENFDVIAGASKYGAGDHNNHYYPYIIDRVPEHGRYALDIGCGLGELTIRLSGRFGHVTGIDLSPGMVERARHLSSADNITYLLADFMSAEIEPGSIDFIASVATMHHLSFAPALARMASLLVPGGTLIIFDLYREEGPGDAALSATAAMVERLRRLRLVRGDRSTEDAGSGRELSNAWRDHEAFDQYMSIREIRSQSREILPSAKIRRHLFWRYSLHWQKPKA